MSTLTLAELAPMMRDAMKDDRYLLTPLGVVVGRYIRWLRNEWGATPSTVRDYEAILARMAVLLADMQEPVDVSTEDLRKVIDTWSERSARTRAKVTSVIRAFWSWAEDEHLVGDSPARKIRRPRAEQKVAPVLPLDSRPRMLAVAKTPAIGWGCGASSGWDFGARSLQASRQGTSTPSADV